MNERMKQLRKTLGLTQQDFADRLGIKRGAIANYEIGRNEPIDAVVSLICREFDVNEDWLRTGEGEMFLTLDRDDQIARWAGTVLRDEGDTFKKRFVAALSQLEERDWVALEQFLLNIKKDPED
jgi:bacteriophage CI repressor helix-turn-helix domain